MFWKHSVLVATPAKEQEAFSTERKRKLQTLWSRYSGPLFTNLRPKTREEWDKAWQLVADPALAAVLDLPDTAVVTRVRRAGLPWLRLVDKDGRSQDAISALAECSCVGLETYLAACNPIEAVLSYLFDAVIPDGSCQPWFVYKRGCNMKEDAERAMRDAARKHLRQAYKNAEEWAFWIVSALRMDHRSSRAQQLTQVILGWSQSHWLTEAK